MTKIVFPRARRSLLVKTVAGATFWLRPVAASVPSAGSAAGLVGVVGCAESSLVFFTEIAGEAGAALSSSLISSFFESGVAVLWANPAEPNSRSNNKMDLLDI